jgi:prepilin-type N-terminal cleavage/methylation domain-containing protein
MKKGFTLIEILVSMGIISYLGIFIVQALTATIRSNSKIEIMKEIKQNGDYAVSLLQRKIQSAQTINCSANNHQLSLTYFDGTTETIQSEYITPTPGCRMVVRTVPPNPTPTIVSVITSTNLVLEPTPAICSNAFLIERCDTISSIDSGVKISFPLLQRSGGTNIDKAQMKFELGAQIRNSGN